jgi:hypothetical protein
MRWDSLWIAALAISFAGSVETQTNVPPQMLAELSDGRLVCASGIVHQRCCNASIPCSRPQLRENGYELAAGSNLISPLVDTDKATNGNHSGNDWKRPSRHISDQLHVRLLTI